MQDFNFLVSLPLSSLPCIFNYEIKKIEKLRISLALGDFLLSCSHLKIVPLFNSFLSPFEWLCFLLGPWPVSNFMEMYIQQNGNLHTWLWLRNTYQKILLMKGTGTNCGKLDYYTIMSRKCIGWHEIFQTQVQGWKVQGWTFITTYSIVLITATVTFWWLKTSIWEVKNSFD